MESWVQNRTDLCCWSRWWASKQCMLVWRTRTALLLSGAHQMHHKRQRENLVLEKCNKFEERYQTKECDFQVFDSLLMVAGVRDQNWIWSPSVSSTTCHGYWVTSLWMPNCSTHCTCIWLGMPLQMSPPSQIESPLPCEERSALCFGSHTRSCLPVCRNSRSWTLGWFALIQWSEYTTQLFDLTKLPRCFVPTSNLFGSPFQQSIFPLIDFLKEATKFSLHQIKFAETQACHSVGILSEIIWATDILWWHQNPQREMVT